MRLAARARAIILSADSMQVYRGMDIGTAKPTLAERAQVPHHLIDLVDPEEPFSVADYQRESRRVVTENSDRRIVVVGGSGLHVRALLDPLEFPPHDPQVRSDLSELAPDEARRRLEVADPQAGEIVDLANPRRVERALEILEITGLTPSQRAVTGPARSVAAYEPFLAFAGFGADAGDQLSARAAARIESMVEMGLVEEVRSLRGRLGVTARAATGYGEFGAHVEGELTLAEAKRLTNDATVALAKRQRTFFGRDPRLTWIRWHPEPEERYLSFRSELDRLGLWTS